MKVKPENYWEFGDTFFSTLILLEEGVRVCRIGLNFLEASSLEI